MNPTGTKSMFAEIDDLAKVIGTLMIAKALQERCCQDGNKVKKCLENDDSVECQGVQGEITHLMNLVTAVSDDLDKLLARYLETGVEKVLEITRKSGVGLTKP